MVLCPPSSIIFFHRKRHSADGSECEVSQFFSHLAVHLLKTKYDIRTAHDLLGHKDVSTTAIYTPVINREGEARAAPSICSDHSSN
ncbi:MAG: hypothetical protein D6723_01380 [Acidobacteria bacterium]|nr:MAG: hypothetical protein D6723_01380 [Acidobacteriota bacterium]